MAAVTIHTDFGAQENNSLSQFTLFPLLFAMKWCHDLTSFLNVVWSQLFYSPLSPSSRSSSAPLHFLPLEWCHLHIWVCWYFSWQSWFQLVIHLAWHFSWCTLHRSKTSRVTIYSPDGLLSQFGIGPLFHGWFFTCIQVSQEAGQVVWYSHLFKNFPYVGVIHTVKGFSIVNEVEVFPELPSFLQDPTIVGNLISGSSASSNPTCTSGGFHFRYCWSLAWRFLSIILQACEMSTIVW